MKVCSLQWYQKLIYPKCQWFPVLWECIRYAFNPNLPRFDVISQMLTNELDIRRVHCSPKKWSWAVAIEKLIMYLTRLGKNTPIYLYLQHGPSLKISAYGVLLLVHVISFFNIMQLFYHRKVQNCQYQTFFLTEILRFAKQNNHRLHMTVSSLVYKAI